VTLPLRQFADGLVDLVFPKRCVACGAAGDWLCAACRPGLTAVTPWCSRCAAPADRRRDGCAECRDRAFAFVGARAAFRYEGPARSLVTSCKFRPLRSLAGEMAALAGEAFAQFAGPPVGPLCYVTCVPVHRQRRLERGFDQAELIARELARRNGMRFVRLLRRRDGGRRQSALSRDQRAANVRAVFAIDDRALANAGKVQKVVIVDDVYTTGETLNQCAHELRSAGIEPHAFAFARSARRLSRSAVPQRRAKERSR
jgi:ComF family protein